MKKILSLLMLLVTIVSGANAADESATLYWESTQTAANSIKIGDFTLAITGNTEKNWSSGNGDITIGSTTYKTLKNSNGAQNTITCPDGYVATGVTFYVTTNADSSGKLTEIDGTSCEDVVTSCKDYDNPTVISKDIANKASFTFTFSTKQVCFIAIVTYKSSAPAAAGPTITTQPVNVEYEIGSTTYPTMSVVATASAGELSYSWEFSITGEADSYDAIPTAQVPSAATATLSGEQVIGSFETLVAGVYYARCKVTDGNGAVYSNPATLTITEAPVAPTISIAADKTMALKGGKIKFTATVTGTPAPTIQWYSKDGELIQAIEGATSAEFTFTTTTHGTFEFLAKATNDAGTADSDPIAIIVKPALQSVMFSNGVYGAIAEPATAEGSGNIEVPYINYGETPEINETSWTAFNDTEANISTEENVVTVTSGDESATYTYEFIPVDPIAATADIASTNFTEDPSWVFNKYGYDAEKGVKFAKAVDDADNLRIAKGNTRQYYFVGPAKSLSLTAVETVNKKSAIRNVNVYVNGAIFKINTANNEIGAITLSPTSDNIVMIEAAEGTTGDGGFSAFSIAACDVKPEITAEPANVEWTVGETTYPSMSVEATGENIYQWEFSTTGDAQTFQAIPTNLVPSAATATLSGEEVISAFSTKLSAGTYYARCRITDAAGTAYSDAATFTIKDGSAPTITTQPQDVTYIIGSETCGNMSVVAEPATAGDALTYQWQYSLNGETFNDIPALYVPSAATATLLGTEAIAILKNLDPKPEKVFIKCVVSETGYENAVSDPANVYLKNATKSVNIEQLVLDNGVKYDIAKEFVDNYIEYASLNALDSLNDAEGKFMRNEPFLGLKLKTSGAYIKVTLKQGSSLKVKLGNIGDNLKVNINGTEQEDIVKMTTKDANYMTTVYEYTADDADAVVTFTTSSASTVVFKQIMIDEEIAEVILPYAVDMPEDAANGTVEMPASANPGDVVTIVATPAEGYELDAITVTGKSNTAYEVSADNTFIMPDENVNVTVTFKQITGINGVAEDAADAENANVKIIKNGKLYIGKYNIAGQLVK